MLDTLIKMKSGKYEVTVIHILNVLQKIYGCEVLPISVEIHARRDYRSIYRILKFKEDGGVAVKDSHSNWMWRIMDIRPDRRTVKEVTMTLVDRRPRICIVVN